MTRAEEVKLLNMIANQPEVLPWVAPGYDHVDLTDFFDRPGNLMLGNIMGVVLFGAMGEGLYSTHFLFTSSLRGRDALHAIRLAFNSLFTYRDCVAITGLIPRENRASRAMVRALGCRLIGHATDSHGRACNSYIMERGRWVTLSGA